MEIVVFSQIQGTDDAFGLNEWLAVRAGNLLTQIDCDRDKNLATRSR